MSQPATSLAANLGKSQSVCRDRIPSMGEQRALKIGACNFPLLQRQQIIVAAVGIRYNDKSLSQVFKGDSFPLCQEPTILFRVLFLSFTFE